MQQRGKDEKARAIKELISVYTITITINSSKSCSRTAAVGIHENEIMHWNADYLDRRWRLPSSFGGSRCASGSSLVSYQAYQRSLSIRPRAPSSRRSTCRTAPLSAHVLLWSTTFAGLQMRTTPLFSFCFLL